MKSVELLRADRPREVVVARVLAIVAAALWVPVTGHFVVPFIAKGFVGWVLVLFVFGVFGLVKGRQAGRVLMTVAFVIVLVVVGPYCLLGFSGSSVDGPAYALLDIAAFLLGAEAILLAYLPRSGRYVHLVRLALARQDKNERDGGRGIPHDRRPGSGADQTADHTS